MSVTVDPLSHQLGHIQGSLDALNKNLEHRQAVQDQAINDLFSKVNTNSKDIVGIKTTLDSVEKKQLGIFSKILAIATVVLTVVNVVWNIIQ